MRRTGIIFEAVRDIRDDRYIELISSLGFEATFSGIMEDAKRQERIARLLGDHGISYDFIHSDFSHINDMWLDGDNGDAMLKSLKGEVERTSSLGIPTIVVHLSSGKTPPSISDIGKKRYTDLVEHAAVLGVSVAFENLRKLANLAWAMEEFADAENVGFCYDCGHENCFTRGIEFMPIFGDRLLCTHIHDNMGIYPDGDDHMIPFDGTVDYRRVTRQIRESGFSGTLMLEVCKEEKQFGECGSLYENMSSEDYLRRAADAAKRLRKMVDDE